MPSDRSAGLTDGDLAAAVVIALAIILVALCVWPGLARVRAGGLAAYWASPQSGELYLITATGPREFAVHWAQHARPGASRAGKVGPLRGVRLASGERGYVDLGRRQILWDDGDVWVRQGVP
jgi:hypothetical protein